MEKSKDIARRLVDTLGLDEKTIDQIQTIPYSQIHEAACKVIPGNPRNLYYSPGMSVRPVIDGEIIPYALDDPRLEEISKGLPTIIGANFCEHRFFQFALANADRRYVWGDTKQYMYIFAKPSPHLDGTFGTNHCTEMPFVFNNIWLGRFMVGADKSAYKLADFMSDVWVSFAKNGVPDVKGFKWEVYNPETTPVVVFNDKTTTVHKSDIQFWEDMKNFKRETWIYRQNNN